MNRQTNPFLGNVDVNSATRYERTHHSLPIQSLIFTMIHLRVNRLKMLPKINVINVQLRMMTLYGIEKSGVGRSTRSVGVYIRFGIVRAPSRSVTGKRTAGGRSQPLMASGGCSVYFKNALLRSMERRSVLLAGIVNVACNVDGPWCPFARRRGGW